MLTSEELILLEGLLNRARVSAGTDRTATTEIITPGDVVQLRPGTCPHWQTSFLLVTKVRDNGGITGTILRPHRSACQEAWYTYRPPEVARIGRAPFPGPGMEIRRWNYCAPCPLFAAEPKPIQRETRGRKRKPASSAEIIDAIEALPKDEQAAMTAWMWARQAAKAGIQMPALPDAHRSNESGPEWLRARLAVKELRAHLAVKEAMQILFPVKLKPTAHAKASAPSQGIQREHVKPKPIQRETETHHEGNRKKVTSND